MKALLLATFILVNGVLLSQTTTTFRINYNQALFDLPGNATESLTSNQYVFAGTNLNSFPMYGTVTELDANGDLVWSKRYLDASLGFQIYNRWGELVFETNDNKECWDGTHKGKLVNTGVYVYKLNAVISGKEVHESGNITV